MLGVFLTNKQIKKIRKFDLSHRKQINLNAIAIVQQ